MRTLLLLFCALAVGLLPAQAQTTADSAPAFARFGATVAADGGTMYVAEANISGKSGIVFAYEKDPSGAWLEIGQIMPAEGEPGERFGTSISADGDVIAIGAPRHNERAGAVYLFTRGEDGLFAQTAMLAADGLAGGDGFGAAVALDGDWLLVGAPGTMERKGAAYAFNRGEDGTWMQAGMMADESGKAKDELGGTLALENGVALVGAPGTKFGGGAVHTYTYTDGAWASAGMLPAEGVKAGNGFGKSVALAGGMAYVGAPMYNRFQGAVLTFSHDGTAWMAGDEISAAEPSRMARFGGALAVDGSRLWVGSTGANGGDGAAYLFEHDGTAWAQTAELMPENPPNNGSFSIDLAASGDAVVIGMAGDDYGAGSAWIYEVGDVTWAPATRVVGEDTSFDPVTGGKLSCEDGPAAGFDCKGMDLVAFLPTKDIGGERGVNLNDIWGWTDPETGKEYALVGRVDGTSFVDITNPEMPVYVGDLPLTEGARPNTWRDIKVFADHAFVVADNAGEHGMQVFDLTQLRGIEEPQTFTETAIYRGINSAHNIVINEETGFAYAVGSSGGGETCGGGLHMIDINEPTNPTFAGCFADASTGRSGTGYSHDAQCVVYTGPDADYSG
ncbi:MAG: choice-of-anchor B family protein, partial [Bacteroidota bacterium]